MSELLGAGIQTYQFPTGKYIFQSYFQKKKRQGKIFQKFQSKKTPITGCSISDKVVEHHSFMTIYTKKKTVKIEFRQFCLVNAPFPLQNPVGKIFTEFTSGHVPPDLTHLIGQERLDLKKLKNYKKWRKAYGNGVQCLVPRCIPLMCVCSSFSCYLSNQNAQRYFVRILQTL